MVAMETITGLMVTMETDAGTLVVMEMNRCMMDAVEKYTGMRVAMVMQLSLFLFPVSIPI
jgi:formylmethanofuran dehydrogenase subunit E